MKSWKATERPSRRQFLKCSAALAGIVTFNDSLLAVAEKKDYRSQAIVPDRTIQLFNGKDLTGFYGWLKDNHHSDPDGIFSVKDGNIRITGQEYGYLATEEMYRDYHLVTEFKWGEIIRPGATTVRNSGLLIHAVGPDGNRNPWMSSVEVQLAQGCVGDFIVIRGKEADGSTIPVTLTSNTIMGPDGRTRWEEGGTPTEWSGKQFWWSKHDPEFKEKLDTYGRWDVESRLDDWTRVEVICNRDRISVIVNDVKVNEAYNVYPQAGKILLESEGFEILFRKVELRPLV